MIRSHFRALALHFVLVACIVVSSEALNAADEVPGHDRTQVIPLKKGWNAVYLEVSPQNDDPAAVFSGLPIDKAATLFKNPGNRQFITDPTVDLSKSQGWGVWYAPELPESFLKSLGAIMGDRAYLIHAKSDCTWRPTGRVTGALTRWDPDSYNFTGFSVAAVGGPTFAQFFAGSVAHKNQAIFRLVDGRWKRVLQPAGEVMRSGEAFWIYCKGSSDYQGPLKVEVSGGVLAVGGAAISDIKLRNAAPHPLSPTVHHAPGTGISLPLAVMVKAFGDPDAPVKQVPVNFPGGAWQQALPALEVGAAFSVPFECRTEELLRPLQGSLLKITTDLGTETWVPVVGRRDAFGN